MYNNTALKLVKTTFKGLKSVIFKLKLSFFGFLNHAPGAPVNTTQEEMMNYVKA
jgi:hypothetical protein